MMKRMLLVGGCLAAAFAGGAARAGIHADALGNCAREATTVEERTTLMRWSFVAALANPRLADLATISPEERERSFRAVGAVFNRVMLTACRREAAAAMRNEGAAGLQQGLRALGEMAGMELMLAPETLAVIGQIDRYLDLEGLERLAREAAITPPV